MNQHDVNMRAYYKERAPIYDDVYSYPERQDDLRYLEKYIPEQLKERDVLEIAAGTGYWTQFISTRANSILATDATPEALEQIQNRKLVGPVHWVVADAYHLNALSQEFTGAFAGLWFSHVPKQRIGEFLAQLHSHLQPGSPVVFIDNSKAQCVRLPLSHTDEVGNTYQDRKLDDGSVHRVLKNFPSEEELLRATISIGKNQYFKELDHFWLFQYVAI